MNSHCLTQYTIRKWTVILIVTLLILPFCFTATAKSINSFRKFSEDNLISYQIVGSITQDKDGFIWFGSQDGLHRYDGHNLRSYHYNNADKNSISSDAITQVLVDSNGGVWVGTRGGGLNYLKHGKDEFQHINAKSTDIQVTDNNITALIEDNQGKLWVATQNGLNILSFDQAQWQIKQIKHQAEKTNSLTNNNIQTLIQLPNGEIWAGTRGGGINVFDIDGEFIRSFTPGRTEIDKNSGKLVQILTTDREGNVWIGTAAGGLIKFDHISNEYLHFKFDENDLTSIASNTVEAIMEDSQGRLWVGTDKGLSVYDKKSNRFTRFNHKVNDQYSLANDIVLTFFEDSNNIIWIGTFSGVNFFDPNTTNFKQYSSGRYSELKNNHISGFSQYDGQSLLISTYKGGIYQLDLMEDTLKELNFSDSIKGTSITKLFSDEQFLWVGTRSSGLFKINRVSKEVTHFKHDPKNKSSISANSVTDIVRDSHDNLWISTFHEGINRLNPNGTFTSFTPTENGDDQGPSSQHIVQIVPDHQGYLWLATYGGGINRFDTSSKTFVHIKHQEGVINSLSSNIAWIMYLDDSQNLWVGTQGTGLNFLSKDNLENSNFSFKRLSLKQGMNTRTVYAISQDSRGDIWFSTNKGVSRYSPRYESFKHFDTTHGLLDMEYNHGVVYRTPDKTLYFGSPKGFNSIESENVLDSRPAPQVRMTNILKLNEPMVFESALSQVNNLEFKHDDQIISFEYVGLDYIDPSSTKYRYRLQGFDNQWINAGALNRATYTNLPAGDYSFEVIAGNNDNVWSDPGLQLSFSVHPAPWNTWYAYLLYAFMTALSLLAYSRQVNRKLLIEQQQKVQLKQEVEEKTQEFQLKNVELEQANKQLENAATTDKITGVKSRRYLDIYIEQATRLMAQIHHNILPVQRSILPRLYLLMVRIRDTSDVTSSQLVNLTDLLLYSRNPDDLVIRWSEDTFAVIGYEKEQNARELANRLVGRFGSIFEGASEVDMAFSFYPFNFEQPMSLTWDHVSVLTEFGLKQVSLAHELKWVGLHGPKEQPFNYLEALKLKTLSELSQLVDVRTS